MIHLERHHASLKSLGLDTIEGVRRFEGSFVERLPGRRDVLRIQIPDDHGPAITLFLKRHWKVNPLKSLFTLGIQSISRREWNNGRRLQSAGFNAAPLVAYGQERGVLGEKFSFIITEAAPGSCTLEAFVRDCHDRGKRRLVFDALAREVHRLHSAGVSMPDLFARHVFFSPDAGPLSFCFIDLARLETGNPLSTVKRARCLAALNVSSPAAQVSGAERVRFLHQYAGRLDKPLAALVKKRTERLLRRRRYQSQFFQGTERASTPAKTKAS